MKMLRYLLLASIVFINQGCSAKSIVEPMSDGSSCYSYHFSNGKDLIITKSHVIRLLMISSFPKQRLLGVIVGIPEGISKQVSEVTISPIVDTHGMTCSISECLSVLKVDSGYINITISEPVDDDITEYKNIKNHLANTILCREN